MRNFKQFVSLIIAIVLLFCFSASAFADTTESSASLSESSSLESGGEESSESDVEEILYPTVPQNIRSEAFVVMDAKTGQVLVEKNMHTQLYPASITKILTVALALENCSLSEKHTMTNEAVRLPANSAHIALQPDEEISIKDLAYAAILPSANDAANGLGEHVAVKLGKSGLADFGAIMNQKAKEVGALNSNFVNPSGLPNDEHVTTAYDMAMITRYALGVKGFRDVFGAITYTIKPTNKNEVTRNIGTQHYMIARSIYYYEGASGGKLGWTNAAKCTCVTVAKRGDVELICVVMKSLAAYDKYEDTTALFDYCFDNFSYTTVSIGDMSELVVPIVENSITTGEITSDGGFNTQLLLHQAAFNSNIDAKYSAPEFYPTLESVEEDLPTVTLTLTDGNISKYMHTDLGTHPLDYSYNRVESDFSGKYAAAIRPVTEKEPLPKAARVFLIIASVLAFLIIGLFVVRAINIYRYRKKRLTHYSNHSKYNRYRT